jgi:hypothetical protein
MSLTRLPKICLKALAVEWVLAEVLVVEVFVAVD